MHTCQKKLVLCKSQRINLECSAVDVNNLKNKQNHTHTKAKQKNPYHTLKIQLKRYHCFLSCYPMAFYYPKNELTTSHWFKPIERKWLLQQWQPKESSLSHTFFIFYSVQKEQTARTQTCCMLTRLDLLLVHHLLV